jgi:CheY-like chemotaxis protein
MPDAKPTVLVIDDDPDLRASIARLLRSLDMDSLLFASISDFLKSVSPNGPTCLVLDVRLPDQSGLDLQRELAAAARLACDSSRQFKSSNCMSLGFRWGAVMSFCASSKHSVKAAVRRPPLTAAISWCVG